VVAEVVGVVSVSPGLGVGFVVEHDGLATQTATPATAPHHDLAEDGRLSWARRTSGRCVGLRVDPLPKRCNRIILVTARVHQPDPGWASGSAPVSCLLVGHRYTSEQE
jgi:hypothetical protein